LLSEQWSKQVYKIPLSLPVRLMYWDISPRPRRQRAGHYILAHRVSRHARYGKLPWQTGIIQIPAHTRMEEWNRG